MADVAQIVRRTRKAQKASQTVLAQLSDVGLRFVVDVERGKPSVRFDKVMSVLSTLGIAVRLELPPE